MDKARGKFALRTTAIQMLWNVEKPKKEMIYALS